MEMALTFNKITLTPVPHQNRFWIRAVELARALGFKREDQAAKIYRAHADEFTPDMAQVVEIFDNAESAFPVKSLLFSLRGCHLLAMFARTPVAKAFRRWVLDVLDKLAEEERTRLSGNVKQIPCAPLSTAASRAPLRSLVHAWAQVSGIPHTALWPQVRAHFQLSRIDDLPESWLPDALAFVQEKIDQCAKGLPQPAPAPELPPAPATPEREERPLIYRDGKFYPPHKNRKHVAGPREKAIMDFWCFAYDRQAKELEGLFKKLMEDIDTAVGDTCSHAVAAIGRDADTMFSISCMLEGFYATRDMAHESFKDALREANRYMRMASAMATAMNR